MRAMLLAPVPEADRIRFEQRFGCQLITQVYGQTELTAATVGLPGAQPVRGSAGKAAPWVELAIVDGDDYPLPAHHIGEIVLRPRFPGVMYDGYWNRPNDTVRSSTTLWHHTGDLGRLDEEGELTFVRETKLYALTES
jgi:carnitine-CoA ligase